MASKQLMDSLTSHIALYSSSLVPPAPANPNINRSSILKWFSSLTVPQRQSHLTIVDESFAKIVLQMESKLRINGHGFFIILPDIPSDDHPSLPSLCYRRSRGLLSRVSESNESERAIRESVRFFNSREGEILDASSCPCLDSVTFSEGFVENVGIFVETMDRISNGEFLKGEESGLGSEWVELGWLKKKGYYTLEAFVGNRLEVALRLSWLHCNNGKKRGIKLKEKAGHAGVAGVAANAFWRRKGCIDWWRKQNASMKKKFLQTLLGKAAKSLTAEVLDGGNSFMEFKFLVSSEEPPMNYNQTRRCQSTHELSMPSAHVGSTLNLNSSSVKLSSLVHKLNSLIVCREISTLLLACQRSHYDEEKLFFSSFVAIGTIAECILRKVRCLLAVVALDCTKMELFEEESLTKGKKKSKDKTTFNDLKKKGKPRDLKELHPVPVSTDSSSLRKSTKDGSKKLTYHGMVCTTQSAAKDLSKDVPSSAINMENSYVKVNGTAQSASKKNKKRRKKIKDNALGNYSVKTETPLAQPSDASSFSIMQGDDVCPNHPGSFENPQIVDIPKDCITGIDNRVPTSCSYASPNDENLSITSTLDHEGQIRCFLDNRGEINEMKSDNVAKNAKELGKISITPKQDVVSIHDAAIANFPVYPSHEWPSVAPVHLPCVNRHLPAATDRLHLDVGHYWKNHFHESFLRTVHRVRNPSIENRIKEILPQPLPMSLDWPLMVGSFNGLVPSLTYSYNSGYISKHPSFHQGFSPQSIHGGAMAFENERIHSSDFFDSTDVSNSQEARDVCDSNWLTEEDFEIHAVSEMDYSQHFGGGVMYWDSLDHPNTNFSRPPSLSSDDSFWAWREADMNRTVDDMVAFSSSYSTNGLTSPSATSFCSPFDPLGFVVPGSDMASKVLHSSSTTDLNEENNASCSLPKYSNDVEAKTGDLFTYPILRPIIIPSLSKERSRSEFKIERPPSPVVLCVPRAAPRPPPPSPVGDSRKHRGFPTVRSGSSSPRNWGVRGWFHDNINVDESSLRVDGSEVVLPSWRKKSLSARQLIALSQLARDQEHPDVGIPLQPPELMNSSVHTTSLPILHSLLHEEIESFCKKVALENAIRKPYINWAVKRVTRSLQVLWPRSRTNVFGSNATGLSLPTSDVDLVVCLPPVRNLEPIKEAGILEGRNGIKETCLQHAARYLANQEWVKNDSLKIVENTAIPIIMLVVEVPHDLHDLIDDNAEDVKSIRLDISFKAPSHTGLQTTELVKELTEQFPSSAPLALVLKQFLADRSLDQSYSGGLSSYCMILLITRFLQHEHHHGRPINQNFGAILMDFLYFFGNVFDPRRMRVSVQGSGVYINRERGYSIDPIYIDDPLFPSNNVGRNCFRIHQCIKAFADAYSVLESGLTYFKDDVELNAIKSCKLLSKIIPSISLS